MLFQIYCQLNLLFKILVCWLEYGSHFVNCAMYCRHYGIIAASEIGYVSVPPQFWKRTYAHDMLSLSMHGCSAYLTFVLVTIIFTLSTIICTHKLQQTQGLLESLSGAVGD